MKQKIIYTFIRLIFLIAFVVAFSPCQAQVYQEKHEVSVLVGGGYAPLYYYLHNVPDSKFTPGYGGMAGLGYAFFFNDFIGIGTGAEVAKYNSQVKISQFSDKYNAFDGEENFEFRYSVNGYTEKQNLLAIQIPLYLQLQFPLFHDEHLTYFSLGGKIGFPISSQYQSSSASYQTSAYYPQYDALLETPQSEGLGTFQNRTTKDKLHFNYPLYMLTAELGMKWMISNNFSLYTGIYLDYSIFDIYRNKQYDSFLQYSVNNPSALPNISILQSKYNRNSYPDSFTGKVLPYFLGVKIRLAFRIPDGRSCCF
jgi:hypothetical protein